MAAISLAEVAKMQINLILTRKEFEHGTRTGAGEELSIELALPRAMLELI